MAKAVVLAAGTGSRLGEIKGSGPKCSVRVQNRPIIQHQIDAFLAAGINDISIVTGYAAEYLEHYPVKRYHNALFRDNNVLRSLMTARVELNDDVVIVYSDLVFEKRVIESAAQPGHDFCIVTDSNWLEAYVGRTGHPPAEAEKVAQYGALVSQVGKHVPLNLTTAEFTGILRLSVDGCNEWTALFDELENIYAEKPFQQAQNFEQAYITDMLQELIDRGFEIYTREVEGAWMEIDTPQDYARAARCAWLEEERT